MHYYYYFPLAFLLNHAISMAPFLILAFCSQSEDAARELVGWTDKVNLYDMEGFYGTFAVTLEGTRSFNHESITRALFGDDACNSRLNQACGDFVPTNPYTLCQPTPYGTSPICCNNSPVSGCCDKTSNCCDNKSCDEGIVITGSCVNNRGCHDWLADYFGLPTTFQSVLKFNPRVSNFIADFDLYLGLDEWLCGAYFRVHAPVVHTRWTLNLCEIACPIEGDTCRGYGAGYFGPTVVPCDQLLCNARSFFSDCQAPNLGENIEFQPLRFSKFSRSTLVESGVADLQFALGWNFWQDIDYHFGFNIRAAAPTGTRPKGKYLFEPIIGNGKHWELGGGLTSHYTFWRDCDDDSSFGIYVDANITHQFRARQTRSFDLIGKPNSRYMIAEQLGTPVNNLFANPNQGDASGSVAPIAQFKNMYTPVANLTTRSVKVSSAIQADVVALFNYSHCGFGLDFGYNFWGRSCEKISPDCKCGEPFAPDTWALKGDASVYGFAGASTTGVSTNDPIALSATNSRATIHGGTNAAGDVADNIRGSRNPFIDNGQYARQVADNTPNANILDKPLAQGGLQTRTSFEPVFINECEIDYDGAKTRGISHKVFAHLGYTWRECDDWIPYLGVGGKAEFGPRHNVCCSTGCNTNNECAPLCASPCESSCNDSCESRCCKTANLSEWGVWVKGGISFN